MTERDFYTEMKELHSDREDIVELCDRKLVSLNNRNNKARARAAERRAAGDELTAVVREVLSPDTFEPIAAILERIEGEDLTASKIVYRVNALVRAGEAEKSEISIKDENGKARKIMGYRLSA